jgi:raffinose/stachyose/melibiose transport system permease protein
MNAKMKTRVFSAALQIILFLLSLLIIIPLLIMILGSFKDSAEVTAFNLALPTQWHFDNYVTVFEKAKLPLALFNSLLITFASTAITILCSSLAAYILARRETKLSHFLYYFFFVGNIIPMQMIPTIQLFSSIGLYGGYVNVILLYSAINIPFSCFLYTGFIKGIPRVMDESAFIEGSSTLHTFRKIVFPLLNSCNITVLLLLFMTIWNEINIPLYFLNNPSKRTMPLSVYQFYGMYGGSSWNLVFADLTIAMLPIVILFLLMQKKFVSGLTEGAIKG